MVRFVFQKKKKVLSWNCIWCRPVVSNSIWYNYITIHMAQLISYFRNSSQWACWSTFKYFNQIVVCSVLSETLHLPQLHLYRSATGNFTYVICGTAPIYLNSLVQTYAPSRRLSSASERRLVVPSQRGTKSLSRTFSWTPDLNSNSWVFSHFQKTSKDTSFSPAPD